MRFLDLSVMLEDDAGWAPWWARTRVSRQGHRMGALAMGVLFGVLPRHLKTGLGWANEELKLSSHGTTHLDAPFHYGPSSGGKPARTVDEVPLEWCFGDGVVLDMRHKEEDEAVSVSDLEGELARIGYRLKAMDIVLVHTAADRFLGKREYFDRGCGVSAEATRWLIAQGIKVMGIDAWGWDAPLTRQAREARRTGRPDVFWAAHYVGVEREYCQLERLTNLGALPAHGFTACCFPLKVKGGSAGPARVVAMLPEETT